MDPASVVELWKVGGITLVFLVGLVIVTSMFITYLKEQSRRNEEQVKLVVTALMESTSATREHTQTDKELKASLNAFNQQSAVLLELAKRK